MHKFKLLRSVLGMSVVVILFFGHISFTQAALISDEQVAEQKKEVLLSIVGTLQEQVKLLQMILIQKLEAEVKHLEGRIANQ